MNTIHFVQNYVQLPKTLKRCHLEGKIIASLDIRITSEYRLKEMILTLDESIVTLENYGFERIQMIEFSNLLSLQSLRGLGIGKNRKVSIINCNNIRDFSPLQNLSIIKISCCDGFQTLSHVQNVQQLSFLPSSEISFQHYCLPKLQILSLSNTSNLQGFDGLETIPELRLHFHDIRFLQSFLETGKPIQNQRIVLSKNHGDDDTSYTSNHVYYHELVYFIHVQYLCEHYDYSDKLPKRWIWIRKGSIKI